MLPHHHKVIAIDLVLLSLGGISRVLRVDDAFARLALTCASLLLGSGVVQLGRVHTHLVQRATVRVRFAQLSHLVALDVLARRLWGGVIHDRWGHHCILVILTNDEGHSILKLPTTTVILRARVLPNPILHAMLLLGEGRTRATTST